MSESSQLTDFMSSFIDTSLHEVFQDNMEVKVQTATTTLPAPYASSRLCLPVSHYEMAEHHRNFVYDAAQPQMVDYSSCIVCETEMIAVSRVTNQSGQAYLTLGLCPCCGYLQHIKRPPAHWYQSFYRDQWDDAGREGIKRPAGNMIMPDPLQNVYGFCVPGQRVLEIGSGWGHAIKAFKLAGFDCYSIEATEHRSQYIRDELEIPCFTGEAEDVPIGTDYFQPESFDLIVSTHVLEHVFNVRDVLKRAHMLLSYNGLAYLEVPAMYSENLMKNTHSIPHTCSFNHANFIYLLQTVGFDLVKDFSEGLNLRVLMRKSPPLTAGQRVAKLDWMSTFLPQRGLAHILEKCGLSVIPEELNEDLDVSFKWYVNQVNQPRRCFLNTTFRFPKEQRRHLWQLLQVIRKRKPLELVADILPIEFVYPTDDVKIWYY